MTPTTPSPDPAVLRLAYLDLLKLSLCDLVGASTGTVDRLPHGRIAVRELRGEEVSDRVEGRDWPAHALTMTGLHRLSDLQRCVETVVADGVEGDLIEAGSWRGGSSMLMRATLDTLGETDRTVWVADSFQGFPSADRTDGVTHPDTVEPYLTVYDFLAVPEQEVRDSFGRLGLSDGVRLVPGFFEHTLPSLPGMRWAIVRLDSDTFDSTLLALRSLYPALAPGGYLIVDDFVSYAECREAVELFREQEGVEAPIESVDWTCARWRKPYDAPEPPPRASAAAPAMREVRAVQRELRAHIPSHEELALEAALSELQERHASDGRKAQERIAALEGQVAEMIGSTSWRITRPLRELGLQIRARQRSSRR